MLKMVKKALFVILVIAAAACVAPTTSLAGDNLPPIQTDPGSSSDGQ